METIKALRCGKSYTIVDATIDLSNVIKVNHFHQHHVRITGTVQELGISFDHVAHSEEHDNIYPLDSHNAYSLDRVNGCTYKGCAKVYVGESKTGKQYYIYEVVAVDPDSAQQTKPMKYESNPFCIPS